MSFKILALIISVFAVACSSTTSQLATPDEPQNSPSPPQASSLAPKVPSGEVSESEFGKTWPLTVPSGTLECIAPQKIIFRTEGKVYAVNGSAKTTGALPIDQIWKDNPEIQGTKIPISGLINRGLELCQ